MTLEGVYASIVTIGERVGKTTEAASIVAHMREECSAVAATHSGPSVRLYIEEWSKPPMASGNWVPELAAIAGAEQVVARAGERSRAFDFRDLVAADPACIVLSICGARDRVPTQEVLSRQGWGVLRAVQRDQVFVIDDSILNRPGPRLIDGARALARIADRVRVNAPAA